MFIFNDIMFSCCTLMFLFHFSSFIFCELKWGNPCSESWRNVKRPSARACLCDLMSWFHSPCSCFLHRHAWISTRWWESSVKWRSFWKARRCASQRASGSWNQGWQRFRTPSPRCLRQINQLVSDKQMGQKPNTNQSHQLCVLVFGQLVAQV